MMKPDLLWGLFIQLMTLVESDSIIICLWCGKQLEADNSIALTTVLNSATLESKIQTNKEKNTKYSMVISQNTTYSRGARLSDRGSVNIPFESISHRGRPYNTSLQSLRISPSNQTLYGS